MLELVEFERRIRSSSRPFVGWAENESGQTYHLCIKPKIRGSRDLHTVLFAEWCGYTLAGELGLPVPNHYLIDVTPEFIESAAGELDDVVPGPAFGSEWQDQAFPALALAPADVSNPQSMAGVCILDTLQFNWDRHSDNVLEVRPGPGSRAPSKLCYIDNGCPPQIGNPYDPQLPIQAQIPREAGLTGMVRTELDFLPYLFSAEALDLRGLAEELLRSPYMEWQVSRTEVLRSMVVIGRRRAAVRDAITREHHRFPRLGT